MRDIAPAVYGPGPDRQDPNHPLAPYPLLASLLVLVIVLVIVIVIVIVLVIVIVIVIVP
jgi:energy-coupling factor transporter transmembrane protein EcfT